MIIDILTEGDANFYQNPNPPLLSSEPGTKRRYNSRRRRPVRRHIR